MRAAFLLIFLWVYVGVQAQDFELTAINLTAQDGLVGDNVYCALQDDKGYIWFGTETGVSRYDGRSFENFYLSDGLADNEIFRIDQDSQGRIWFSAYNGRLSYYQDGRFHNPDNDSILAKVDLGTYYQNFLESSDGTIWFNSSTKVTAIGIDDTVRNYSFQSQREAITIFKEEDGIVKGANFNSSGEIYFSDANGILAEPVIHKITQDLAPFYESYLSGNKVVLATSRRFMTRTFIQGFKDSQTLPPQTVSKFHDYPGEPLWFCSYNGAYKLSREENDTEVYFRNKNVTHMLKDREGGYWFTTSGHGVFYASSLSNRSITRFKNGPIGGISSLMQDEDKIWFGGSNGKFGYLEDGEVKEGSIPVVEGRARVRQIMKGKRPKEVLMVAEELFARVRDIGNLDIVRRSAKVMSYWQDSLIVQGMSRGLNVLQQQDFDKVVTSTDKWQRFIAGKKANNVFSLSLSYAMIDMEPYKGGLLISTSKGLYYLNKDYKYDRFQGHPVMREIINDVRVINEEDYLLATHGLGTYYFRHGEWIHFSTEQGLTSDIHRKIFVISDEEFWIVTNVGLNKVLLKEGKIITQSATRKDGLLSEDVSDVLIVGNKVYAATSKGISVIDLDDWKARKTPPKINIKALSVNGSAYHELNPLLSHKSRNIEMAFDGIHFKSLDQISYEYRLLGLDESWSKTSANKVNFGSLPPGAYTFEVVAQSAFGSKSTVSALSFTIASPIWSRWWFVVLLAAAFVTLVILIANQIIRRNKLKAQKALDFELRIAEAERKALQSQLNPHFIFNSLNSIQAMVLEKNPEEAYSYLEKFSKLIRRILEFSEKSMVSLNDELETLRLYMDLENLRLDGKFDYQINVAKEVSLVREIPSLITQPYVENSIWHGIMPLEHKRGSIVIEIYPDEAELIIDIIDNGVGRQQSGEGMGTRIVSELVRKFKGDQSGEVEVQDLFEDDKPAGTKVSIRILEAVYG